MTTSPPGDPYTPTRDPYTPTRDMTSTPSGRTLGTVSLPSTLTCLIIVMYLNNYEG